MEKKLLKRSRGCGGSGERDNTICFQEGNTETFKHGQ